MNDSGSDPANDPRPQRWRRAFRAHREEAQALAAGLSPEVFNHQPEEGAWSIAQCLDHLCKTAGPLVPRLREALAACGRARAGQPQLGLLDRLFAWMMTPGGRLKMPSPGAYRPPGGALDPARTLGAFQTLQDDLAACAETAEGRDWSAVRVQAPASRLLRLTVGGWLEATRAHQERHLRQARVTLARSAA